MDRSSILTVFVPISTVRDWPTNRRNREKTKTREKKNMKGLLRPYLLVQESDHFPSMGTLKSAMNGATPRMMDMCVSENPDLRRRGGMKVNATQAAISRPPTTAFMATRREIDGYFDILILFRDSNLLLEI